LGPQVTLADRLLALAREKARQRALQNVTFRVADMLELDYPAESFDAVLCVFGIFLVPDMPTAVVDDRSGVRTSESH
jgi:ubiquinone/menaquinone biosynthesis C-methylase UbiE